ncbi:hypothetical protein BTUL_0112g00240 [Botrytis tulipae]|uniref:AAA+ ATPase domain-containing protein n=1 Tax=Botrytis tulipae TaxID=87230 RepID=A0A4Z1EFV9_9HELO|nr:hypothetical protein BTUL_0112g00240 [Botrytis tulipae]
MDSEIAQASHPSRLSKLVKLSRGSKKKGLTNVSGLHRLGGRTSPENDKSETDEEGKNDEDDDEDDDEDYDEGEKNVTYGDEDQSTPVDRVSKLHFNDDVSNSLSYSLTADISSTLKPDQSKPKPESAKPLAPPQNVGKTQLTISDNLSTDDNKKNRRLLALKPRSPKPASTSNLDVSDNQPEGYIPGEIGLEGSGGLNVQQRQQAYQLQSQYPGFPPAFHPVYSPFTPIQNEPLSPQVDSVFGLFSALGIDAMTMGIPSESLNNAQAFRQYLLQMTQAKEPNRFIVFRDYKEKDIPTSKEMVAAAATDNNSGITKSPVHEEEKILAVSEHLMEAIKSILKSKPEFADLLAWFEKDGTELPSPFVFIYHSRAVIQELIEETFDPNAVRQLKLMIDYIYKNYGAEYDAVDTMFDASHVSKPYIKYLFKPGDVLVKGTGSDVNGYMFVTWPHDRTSITASLKEDGKNKPSSQYTMDVRSWSFDSAFNRVSTRLTLEIDGSEKTEYATRDSNIRPIAYASDEDGKTLQSRGEMFWKCRERHFVSYQEHGRGDLHGASEERYMIDMKTFRELHPEDEKKKASDTLDEDAMAQDSPPYPSFVDLLPRKIIGYNMRRKKWVELHADWLSEVVWDKKAFKKLVLAQKTKDLIEALIVNQIAAEKSTDLISGKGNGLILLLHGGPGTGKTLTAESVAEIAEKPLYRVTCGDIGSESEEVEQYLNSVLDLGKVWSCVVLLDEADVFLEERSMSDIKRNALVSIFLRVLEYHDGIIILTSNRVGTFDEAFKSRIQLALHYPSLTKVKRCDIWTMFITRLRELGETQVDFADLEDHRWDLANYKLNGRQIRNAIQTSRQFVSWKNAKEKTTLNFEILKQIIEISGEFDVYVNKLNNWMSPDQLAEEDGLRLSEARE